MLKRIKKFVLSLLSIFMVISLVNLPMKVNANSEELDSLVNDLILYYRDYEEEAASDLGRLLNEIKSIDEDQYEMWKKIITYWHEVRSEGYVTEGVPVGMPNDNSLVILVLGAALNPDGTIKDELAGRLNVALEIANAYPNAYIAVSGGATAANNPDVTEGGVMAEWLVENGVSEERLIIETQAPDTVGNVNYVYNILKRDEYSSIDSICVVTSDYHVPRGLLLAYTRTLLGQLNGDKPLNIVGNAGYFGTGKDPETTTTQAKALASMAGITLGGSVELSTPVSLSIKQNTPYEIGKDLDLAVSVTYNTNYTKDVTELVEITNFDSSLDANQTITVSYTENGTTISGEFTLTSTSKEVVDKTSLEEAIASAEAIDTTKYTDASVLRLTTALANAKALLEDDNTTFAQMNEAIDALTIAIQRLVYDTSSSDITELATGKTVTASGNTKNASRITTDNLKCWISPEPGAGSYFYVDLEAEYSINEITILPYYSTSYDMENWDMLFDLYVSTDAENWSKVASQTEYKNVTEEGWTFKLDTSRVARYVKFVGVEANNDYSNSTYPTAFIIKRMLVYGTSDMDDPNIGNIALGRPTSESLNASTNASYYKVVDGSTSGYWAASSYKNRPWVCIDLEDVYELSSINVVTLYTSKRIYNYELYTSIDGESFTYLDAYTGTDYSTIDGITFDLSDEIVYARYIRLVGTYHSKNSGFHLNELRVYGDLADDALVDNYIIEIKKQELAKLIEEYSSKYSETDYSESTWLPYIESINEGKEILDNENATVEEIDEIINKIKTNAENLKYRPDETKEAGSIRIASFNLAAYNHPDTEAILNDLFVRYAIDYVGLQEVDKYTTRNNLDVLEAFVDGENYIDSYFGKFMDYQGGEYGVGLLSSTEIKETNSGYYVYQDNVQQRGWSRMLVEVDGKDVAIYVTHLSLDYKINRSDVEQMIEAFDADETEYKVLTGDFNCHREWMYPFLVNYNLANGKDGNWLNTAGDSWKEGSVSAPYGLDNIITTRNIDVTKIKVVDSTDYSDHNLIFVECKLLDEEVPSTEYLDIEVTDAKELVKEKYTEESYAVLENALVKAESLKEDALQSEINEVLVEVQTAVANLERIIPNVSEGKTVNSVGTVENTNSLIVDGDIYTCWTGNDYPDSIILDLEDLYEVDEITVYPQENTPRYYHYNVYTSIDGINYELIGEKTTNEIEDYKGATYNVDGMARYVKVEMLENSVATTVNLGEVKVYASLVENVDDLKAALKELIDAYSQLSEDEYIPTGYEALQQALENAIAVYNDAEATKEEIETVYNALEEAYSNLEKYADKTALNALIEENKDKDLSGYSEKSSNEFLEALAHAIEISEDPYVSQEEVDEAYIQLLLAIEDLIAPINIAKNMLVTVESNNDTSNLITDGKNTTTWTSETNVENSSVVVDLDGIYALDEIDVVINTGSEGTYDFDIYVSENGETWTKVIEERNSNATNTTEYKYELEKVNTRYIKVVGVAATNATQLSISEILAYGEEVGNIALDKPLISCAQVGDYGDRKTNDGNRYNYWSGGKSKDYPWVTVDLEGIYNINDINVITHWANNDRYYRFQIYTSIDGEEFTLLTTYAGNDRSTIQGYKFNYTEDVYARYIKVVGNYNSANTYFHLNEVRVYGEEVDYEAILKQEELTNYLEEVLGIDLSVYTEETVENLLEVIETVKEVLEDSNPTLEEVIAAYEQLENAVNSLELKEADYSKVDEAISQIPEDLSGYTEETIKAVREAVEAVVRGLDITQQETVDGYATAILEAISKLEKVTVGDSSDTSDVYNIYFYIVLSVICLFAIYLSKKRAIN